MNKLKNYWDNHYGFICVALIALIYFIKLCSVKLFVVDAIYEKIAVCDFPQIIQFVKWHIMNYNGRTIVHCFAILFLRNKWTKIAWKLLTSFMIPFSGYLIARNVSREKKTIEACTVFSILCFFLVGPVIYTESIYWLAGSFNYFYPVAGIIAVMLLYQRNPNSIWLFPISFILGATTEQVGIMSVGLFVLIFADRAIRTKKFDIRLAVCIILAAVGYLSVLLSPGTSSRMDRQGNISIKNTIYNFFMVLRDKWFADINLFFILAIITAFTVYWMIKLKNSSKITKIINIPVAVVSASGFLINTGYFVFNKLLNKLIIGISFPTILNYAIFIIWILCVASFFLSFAYSAILIYTYKKSALPVISFILGTGSQMVMGISTKAIFRACFPAVIMYLIYIVYSFKDFYEEYAGMLDIKKYKAIRAVVCILCIALCTVHAFSITHYMVFGDTAEYGEIKPMTSEETEEYTDWLFERNKTLYSEDWENSYDLTDFSKY